MPLMAPHGGFFGMSDSEARAGRKTCCADPRQAHLLVKFLTCERAALEYQTEFDLQSGMTAPSHANFTHYVNVTCAGSTLPDEHFARGYEMLHD